jgi:hypothetical protein
MAIGVTMLELRRLLRAETGQSVNPAQGVQAQAAQDVQIERQQRELWDAYDWPHLRFWFDKSVSAGQSAFAYPAEMGYDQINRVYWSATGESNWKMLAYGIRAFDSHPNAVTTGTPTRWSNAVEVSINGITDPAGSLLLHPVPDHDGLLRFEGQAPLNPLVNDTDKCVIDSTAIILFAAAEVLATQKAEVAQMKLQKAQNYLRKLLSNNGAEKRGNYNMGGSMRSSSQSRPVAYIDYIP